MVKDNGCNDGLTLEMPSNDVSAYAIDTVYDTHLHLGLNNYLATI